MRGESIKRREDGRGKGSEVASAPFFMAAFKVSSQRRIPADPHSYSQTWRRGKKDLVVVSSVIATQGMAGRRRG